MPEIVAAYMYVKADSRTMYHLQTEAHFCGGRLRHALP